VTETKEFLKAKKEAAPTAPEQIKKDLKEGQNEVWWGRIVQTLTIYRDKIKNKLVNL